MKKKILSLLLTATMVFSVCACGKSEETQNTVESSGTQSSESKQQIESTESVTEDDSLYPLVDEPVTVKGIVVTINKGSDNRIVFERAAEITGINIEWEVIDSASLPTLLASGDWPDVIFGLLNSTMIYDYGVLGGKLVNYLDYLDVMPHFAQAMEDYPLLKKGAVLSNGGLYQLGYINNSATSIGPRAHVNTAVMEEAGVKIPTTVDEFEQALKDLKDYYGVCSFIPKLNNYKNNWSTMLYAAFGTGCNPQWDVDDDGNVYFAGMSDQMRHYYEFLNKLYEQELIHQELATMDSTAIKELELSGKVAFPDTAGSDLPANENGEWTIDCVPPLTSEYDSTQEVIGHPYVAFSNSFYINNDSKYVKELCQLIDIAYAKDEVVEGSGLMGISFTYGIEGEHWIINDDGTYSFINQEGYDNFNTFQGNEIRWYNIGRADEFAGLLPDTPSNSRARQLAYVKNVAPYSQEVVFPADFLTFTEDQQYVIDNKWTEIDTYAKKMQVEFVTGVTDIENGWDVYLETLKKMGIEEVVAVYQEAYETFISK